MSDWKIVGRWIPDPRKPRNRFWASGVLVGLAMQDAFGGDGATQVAGWIILVAALLWAAFEDLKHEGEL